MKIAKLVFSCFVLCILCAEPAQAQQTPVTPVPVFVKKVDESKKPGYSSDMYYPAFMKYPVTEQKKPELKNTNNKDWDITVYNNEMQHWYYLYDKKGYVEKYGPLPDLTNKKVPEGNTPMFDAATAPEEYRNYKPEQK